MTNEQSDCYYSGLTGIVNPDATPELTEQLNAALEKSMSDTRAHRIALIDEVVKPLWLRLKAAEDDKRRLDWLNKTRTGVNHCTLGSDSAWYAEADESQDRHISIRQAIDSAMKTATIQTTE
jgi:hypothetical protein